MYDHFDLNINPALAHLGLGCAALGNDNVTDDEGVATIHTAWDAGIRTFDVAPMYGSGNSEYRLGLALRDKPRNEYRLSTKVGRLVDEPNANGVGPSTHFDFSADGIKRSLEQSLTRLGLDRIDLLLIHDPDNHWQQAIDEAWPVLEDLRSQGVVKAVGAGMNQVEMLQRFAEETSMDIFLVAGKYTLLDQSALNGLFQACEVKGIRTMHAQSLHGGLIEGDPNPTLYYKPTDGVTNQKVARIRDICRSHGVPAEAAALQFPLGQPVPHGVLTGPAKPDQLPSNLAWWTTLIPDAVWSDLKAAGLLDERVPTPFAS